MTPTSQALLLVLALAGTFALRAAGVLAAGRIEEGTPLFRWIGCVAFAIAAGLMGKILLLPSGVLAEAPLLSRLGGVAIALAVFFLLGRRLFVSLGVGVAAFFLLSLALPDTASP